MARKRGETRGAKKRVSDDVLGKLIIKYRGILSAVADASGYDRTTIYSRISDSKKLQRVAAEARDRMVDAGESALCKAVDREESWAVSLLLKTLGKHRGYIEQQNVGLSGDVKVELVDRLNNALERKKK